MSDDTDDEEPGENAEESSTDVEVMAVRESAADKVPYAEDTPCFLHLEPAGVQVSEPEPSSSVGSVPSPSGAAPASTAGSGISTSGVPPSDDVPSAISSDSFSGITPSRNQQFHSYLHRNNGVSLGSFAPSNTLPLPRLESNSSFSPSVHSTTHLPFRCHQNAFGFVVRTPLPNLDWNRTGHLAVSFLGFQRRPEPPPMQNSLAVAADAEKSSTDQEGFVPKDPSNDRSLVSSVAGCQPSGNSMHLCLTPDGKVEESPVQPLVGSGEADEDLGAVASGVTDASKDIVALQETADRKEVWLETDPRWPVATDLPSLWSDDEGFTCFRNPSAFNPCNRSYDLEPGNVAWNRTLVDSPFNLNLPNPPVSRSRVCERDAVLASVLDTGQSSNEFYPGADAIPVPNLALEAAAVDPVLPYIQETQHSDTGRRVTPPDTGQHSEFGDDDDDDLLWISCKICRINIWNVVYIPCGHGSCYRCYLQLLYNICPFCRSSILKTVKPVLSNKLKQE